MYKIKLFYSTKYIFLCVMQVYTVPRKYNEKRVLQGKMVDEYLFLIKYKS